MKMKKRLSEVMAGENVLKLSHSQKRVVRKILDAGNPKLAAQQIIQSPDSRNLVQASKDLLKYGYVTTEPPVLGHHDEPNTIELTDLGQEAAEEYDIQNDEKLLKPEEKEAAQPEDTAVGEEPAGEEGGLGGEELGGEEGLGGEEELGGEGEGEKTDLEGEGVGLELSSFFKTINDLARMLKS